MRFFGYVNNVNIPRDVSAIAIISIKQATLLYLFTSIKYYQHKYHINTFMLTQFTSEHPC